MQGKICERNPCDSRIIGGYESAIGFTAYVNAYRSHATMYDNNRAHVACASRERSIRRVNAAFLIRMPNIRPQRDFLTFLIRRFRVFCPLSTRSINSPRVVHYYVFPPISFRSNFEYSLFFIQIFSRVFYLFVKIDIDFRLDRDSSPFILIIVVLNYNDLYVECEFGHVLKASCFNVKILSNFLKFGRQRQVE